jgi:hypothetical protein
MLGAAKLIELAEEAEALAASSVHPLVRISFEMLAQDYRALAKQQAAAPPPVPESVARHRH